MTISSKPTYGPELASVTPNQTIATAPSVNTRRLRGTDSSGVPPGLHPDRRLARIWASAGRADLNSH